HAMLENVIKRIFGVLKNCFRILLLPSHFNMEVQACIPPALCLVHNVIHVHDPDDMLEYCQVNLNFNQQLSDTGTLAEGAPTEESHTRSHNCRETIAHHMWADYNTVRQERGLLA
ncbi:hypothetical protein BDR03DRAFT_859121, partial [Suillus americanus]